MLLHPPGGRKVLHLVPLWLLLHSASSALIGSDRHLHDSEGPPEASLACRDGDGRAVDWWLILKGPNGTRYGYIDASTASMSAAANGSRRDHFGLPLFPASAQTSQHRSGGGAAALGSGWHATRHLNSQRSPLSRTLLPLYTDSRLTQCVPVC